MPKYTKKEKKLKREIEILKAQIKTQKKETKSEVHKKTKIKKQTLDLPIKYIKKDVTKTFLFSVFTIGLLLVIKISGINLLNLLGIPN